MQPAALIDHIESDGRLLIAAARRAGWDAQVPGCEWNVRELVKHTGGIHRWAASVVNACSPSLGTDAGRAVGSGPDDDELAEWFEAGHAALVATLRSAAPDLECATFLPADSPRHFWSRRQAHETAIHRVDAEGATSGDVTPFEVGFAQDGIGEMLRGFVASRPKPPERQATFGFAAADGPSWLATFRDDRIDVEQTEQLDLADVTVRGTSSDLYRWLWNRPSDAKIDGDVEVAKLWADTIKIRWN